jgi:hypothetical protein
MEKKEVSCATCSMRAKYDVNKKSFVGRFWRWHINFCPGWKAYFLSLSAEEREVLSEKYNFKKYL